MGEVFKFNTVEFLQVSLNYKAQARQIGLLLLSHFRFVIQGYLLFAPYIQRGMGDLAGRVNRSLCDVVGVPITIISASEGT